MHFPNLFSPSSIGTCTVRNRIIMALFPTKYATDSRVNAKMTAFYEARALGGAGLIVLDGPCLDYPALYKGPTELRWDQDVYVKPLKELLQVIHDRGSKAFMHLNYPKEKVFKEPVKGAKQKGAEWVLPLANTMSSIEASRIIDVMAAGASKARAVGYDGVEIQASYGDLIAQLLSPLLNKRTDDMAGCLENRARFLVRLIQQVKVEAGSDFPVMVKLVCHEFVPGGLDVGDAKEIAALLEQAGADAIVANGGNKSTKFRTIPTHESLAGSLVDLAAGIRSVVRIPVVAIGKINRPDLAEDIICDGKADFVAMARALVADPEFPDKAAQGKVDDIRGCICCLQDCTEKGVPGIGRCCTVNPFAGHEYDWKVTPAAVRKRVLVVGGGPSGMQAAVVAGERGHAVELWERAGELGGQALLAGLAPHKGEVAEAVRYLRHRLAKSSVQVVLNKEARLEQILSWAPDVVIVATGSRAGRLRLPGSDADNVVDVRTAFRQGGVSGRNIVIVGGGDTGCEAAEWLADQGCQVSVLEMLPKVLPKMSSIPRERLLARLSAKGVQILTRSEVTSIEKARVCAIDEGGKACTPAADTIVVAVEPVSEKELARALEGHVKEVVTVGDAVVPGNIGFALKSATEVALRI
jgi:2,4-dienoyl-CoA reductase-like NADH-dependent reductase (Old Yellow Enzyme family)/thioredoxin reductase